ncbi:META domain-containing protein [Nitrospira sp. NS4]|uniref:META domain-containing protein n=1 Tax=Nitrospira sp. NS4 TaxID=3414498 RepID=UPI003C2C4702
METTRPYNLLAAVFVGALACAAPVACAADPAASLDAGAPSGANRLAGIKWRVVELSGHPVATPLHGERPFILFDQAKQQVTGYAGCNRFFGGYELDGAALTFGPIGATKMACPDLEAGLETEFFKVLDATRGWKVVEGVLRLLSGDAVLARLEKVQGP